MYNKRGSNFQNPCYFGSGGRSTYTKQENARLISSLFNRDRGKTQQNEIFNKGPNLAVKTESYSNTNYKVACASMQGWRVDNEDSHTCVLSVPTDPHSSFFGVFDGHGGVQVSKFLKDNLLDEIFAKYLYLIKQGKMCEALRQGFIATDKCIKRKESLNSKYVGSTANVIIITNKYVYCANTGDSRTVTSILGHAAPLSFDHKPDNPEEKKRIEATGGWIRNNRVNGSLAVSRAFGDHSFKTKLQYGIEFQIVSCYPDITVKELGPEIEFIIMACDGIWEVKSNQEVIDFVRFQLSENIQPEQVLKNLFMECVATPDSNTVTGYDNMSAILICFQYSKPYENFVHRCMMPKEIGLDPHMFVMQLESGHFNPDAIIPQRQRRWGFPHMGSTYYPRMSDPCSNFKAYKTQKSMPEKMLCDNDKLNKLLRKNAFSVNDQRNECEYRLKTSRGQNDKDEEENPKNAVTDTVLK